MSLAEDAGPEADRFRRASQHYTTGRPAYPALLISRVAELVGLRPPHHVLDLGTGPGFLAIDFAAHAARVTAVDPSSEMLHVARRNAERAGVDIDFVQGRASDLAPPWGRFHLVTIGRAFHWMDREDALRRLDDVVEPGGAVVLFSDRTPDVPANAWAAGFRKIREKYAAADHQRQELHASAEHNDAILLASAFDAVERHSVLERRATPLGHFVDRVLSFSSTWIGAEPSLINAVEEDVRAELSGYAIDGIIPEVIEGRAVIARRSRERPVDE